MGANELASLRRPEASLPGEENAARRVALSQSAGRTRAQLGKLRVPARFTSDVTTALHAIDALQAEFTRGREGEPDPQAQASSLTKSLMALGIPECQAIGVLPKPHSRREPAQIHSTQTFVSDVRGATVALGTYGDAVNRAGGPTGLASASADLRASTNAFEANIEALSQNSLNESGLEAQSLQIVSGGRSLADLMRDVARTAEARASDRPGLVTSARRFETAAGVFAQMTGR